MERGRLLMPGRCERFVVMFGAIRVSGWPRLICEQFHPCPGAEECELHPAYLRRSNVRGMIGPLDLGGYMKGEVCREMVGF
jgi:hypothetical protein